MNANIYTGNVQPNHKEFKIWVNDEGIIKTWNGTEWIEYGGGSSSDDKIIYYELHDGHTLSGTYDCMHDMFASIKILMFGKYCFGYWATTEKDDFSGFHPLKAVAFMPLDIDFNEEDGEAIHMRFDDLESLLATMREWGWSVPDGPFIKRRITAEEYWDTTLAKLTFILKSDNNDYQKTFDFQEGMTWEQWVESDYNTDGLEKASYFADKTNVYFYTPNSNEPSMVTDTKGTQSTWSDIIYADMYCLEKVPV